MNTEEILHVYEAHTANGTRIIEGEESEYSRNELLEIIKEARDDMINFKERILVPALDELEKNRVNSYS